MEKIIWDNDENMDVEALSDAIDKTFGLYNSYVVTEIIQVKGGVRQSPKYNIFHTSDAYDCLLYFANEYDCKNGIQLMECNGHLKFVINGQMWANTKTSFSGMNTVEFTFKLVKVDDSDLDAFDELCNNQTELGNLYKASTVFVK